MYNNIRFEMVEAGIAVLLDELVYMDQHRNQISNDLVFGFPVTHNIIYLSYAIITDELDGNISQKGSSHISGAKLLCKKGSVLKKITSS